MESQTNARLPSIRELELSFPTSTAGFGTEPAAFSPYALSPTYSHFPSSPALTPSSNGTSGSSSSSARPSAGPGGDEGGGHYASQRRTSVSDVVHAAEQPSGPDIAPLPAADPATAHVHQRLHTHQTQTHTHTHTHAHTTAHALQPLSANRRVAAPYVVRSPPLAPHHHSRPHPTLSLNMNIKHDKRPFITTPPRSPDRTPLAVPPPPSILGFHGNGEASSPSTDDAMAETRRQRRESKERRRRRDQRSLTVCMERSVPSWVFSRLKTRHSASKVNGGGRATNAVISGSYVWIQVMNRALLEGVPHWSTNGLGTGTSPAIDRWLQLVDEEAASMENYDVDDDLSPMDLV